MWMKGNIYETRAPERSVLVCVYFESLDLELLENGDVSDISCSNEVYKLYVSKPILDALELRDDHF